MTTTMPMMMTMTSFMEYQFSNLVEKFYVQQIDDDVHQTTGRAKWLKTVSRRLLQKALLNKITRYLEFSYQQSVDERSGWRLVYQVRFLFHLGTSEGWISEGAGPKTKVTRLWKAKGNSTRQGQKSLVGSYGTQRHEGGRSYQVPRDMMLLVATKM